MLAIHVCEQMLAYTGDQLRPHFAFHKFGVLGDSLVVFEGECKVELEAMVDLEDVRNEAPIYSPRMLHFLIEHFDCDLRQGVLRQRLLAHLLADELRLEAQQVMVRGDDVVVSGRKATVSIATRSMVSVLIHFGINVEIQGTPLPTWGLAEAGIDATEFARTVATKYAYELADIERAATKVRAVS